MASYHDTITNTLCTNTENIFHIEDGIEYIPESSNSVKQHLIDSCVQTHCTKQETADFVTFTEETLNGKLLFLCSDNWIL